MFPRITSEDLVDESTLVDFNCPYMSYQTPTTYMLPLSKNYQSRLYQTPKELVARTSSLEVKDCSRKHATSTAPSLTGYKPACSNLRAYPSLSNIGPRWTQVRYPESRQGLLSSAHAINVTGIRRRTRRQNDARNRSEYVYCNHCSCGRRHDSVLCAMGISMVEPSQVNAELRALAQNYRQTGFNTFIAFFMRFRNLQSSCLAVIPERLRRRWEGMSPYET